MGSSKMLSQTTLTVLLLTTLTPPPTASFVIPNNPSFKTTTSLSSTTNRDLPDYGKTTVEVDQIRLTKIKKWRRKDLNGKSLIDQTLEEMENDSGFIETSKRLVKDGAQKMSKEERAMRRRALTELGVPDFLEVVGSETDRQVKPLMRKKAKVFQLNIGLYCNQACGHCHVDSSPLRQEMMSMEVAVKCMEILKNSPEVTTLDITGGAPELNDQFRLIVQTARAIRPDLEIIDRCNLTVLHEPGQEDLVSFLAANRVRIVASLPCYSAENVDQQRGNAVFERSISALLALNEAGYGVDGRNLDLNMDLVYNPLGAFLPPPQEALEVKYKEVLENEFGILFDQLFTITNMPIKRFADFLHRRGELKEYMDLLVRNFNGDTLTSLMCLDTVNVGWDGKIFDCDFNQQLGYGIGSTEIHEGGKTVMDISSLNEILKDPINTDNHCFGCTAGMGSS